jgi:predicted Zn-dependent protease
MAKGKNGSGDVASLTLELLRGLRTDLREGLAGESDESDPIGRPRPDEFDRRLLRDVDTVGLQMTRVSSETETRIGNAIAAEVASRWQSATDSATKAYVTGVGDGLVRAMDPQPFHYTFDVLEEPSAINAFAVPGGHIYVTMALLKSLRSEADLAAVLGHEISHVAQAHDRPNAV